MQRLTGAGIGQQRPGHRASLRHWKPGRKISVFSVLAEATADAQSLLEEGGYGCTWLEEGPPRWGGERGKA